MVIWVKKVMYSVYLHPLMIHLFWETNLCHSGVSLDCQGHKTLGRSVAALSLPRLTGDKSFNAHQEILPAWQFLVSVDSNSEGEINFLHLCHPNVAGTAMIVLRRQLASCELVLLLIKLTLMPYWSFCYKLRLCEMADYSSRSLQLLLPSLHYYFHLHYKLAVRFQQPSTLNNHQLD